MILESCIASSWLKLPEISACPPAIGSLIVGFEITWSPQMIERFLPLLFFVTSKNFSVQAGVREKETVQP